MPSKELTPSQWEDRIVLAQKYQEKFADSNSWARYKAYYRHKFPGIKIIPVNMYYSILRSMVPQIYPRNPRISVTPRRPSMDSWLRSRVVQTIDNWLLVEMATKGEIKKMIHDNFFCGIAAGTIGYDSQFGTTGVISDPFSPFSRTGDKIEYQSNVRVGLPWFLRVRPEDIVFPVGAQDATSLEWYAFRVFRPLEDVEADSKYENKTGLPSLSFPFRKNSMGQADPEDLQSIGSSERQYVELWEIHDIRSGKVKVIVKGHSKFLRDEMDDLQIEGLNVETLVFNSDPDYIYGIPDGRIIEPQQLELNEIRTQAMKHRRIDLVKAITKKGVFSATEIEKMTDEQVMSIIEADVESGLADSIMPMPASARGVLQDMSLAAEQVRQDVREMVGFSRTSQGEYQGKTHVAAAETRAVMAAHGIRVDERQDMIADMLTRIIRKVNQLIFTRWDAERVASIVGPDGAQYWVKFTGQQLLDEYDYIITPEEGADLDTATKIDLAVKAGQVWSQMNQGMVAQGMPVPAEIQRMLWGGFQDTGLDIDRLLAQQQAIYSGMRGAQPGQPAPGATPGQPVAMGQLAAQLGGQTGA